MNIVEKKFFKQCLGMAAVALLWNGFATAAIGAQSLSMAWNASKDKSVAGYCLYYGTAGGEVKTSRVVLSKKKTLVTVPGLKEGATYYFSVTSYDINGVESQPSPQIPYIVPGILRLGERSNPGDPSRIKFPVAPKHKYLVQSTEDMKNWTTIGQVKGANNSWVEFDDAAAAGQTQRYYRLVLK